MGCWATAKSQSHNPCGNITWKLGKSKLLISFSCLNTNPIKPLTMPGSRTNRSPREGMPWQLSQISESVQPSSLELLQALTVHWKSLNLTTQTSPGSDVRLQFPTDPRHLGLWDQALYDSTTCAGRPYVFSITSKKSRRGVLLGLLPSS